MTDVAFLNANVSSRLCRHQPCQAEKGGSDKLNKHVFSNRKGTDSFSNATHLRNYDSPEILVCICKKACVFSGFWRLSHAFDLWLNRAWTLYRIASNATISWTTYLVGFADASIEHAYDFRNISSKTRLRYYGHYDANM